MNGMPEFRFTLTARSRQALTGKWDKTQALKRQLLNIKTSKTAGCLRHSPGTYHTLKPLMYTRAWYISYTAVQQYRVYISGINIKMYMSINV